MSDIPAAEVVSITLLTLRVTLAATLVGTLVGVPLGAAIGLRARPGARLFRVLLYSLYALPPVLAGLVGYLLLSREGWLGSLHLLFTPAAMVLVEAFLATPLIAGLTIAALAEVPANVREAVLASGAAGWRRQLVLVGEARFGILAAIMVGFGRSLAEVAGALLVGGNVRHETRTLGTAILQEVSQGDFGFALALGYVLLGLAFFSVVALAWVQSRQRGDAE